MNLDNFLDDILNCAVKEINQGRIANNNVAADNTSSNGKNTPTIAQDIAAKSEEPNSTRHTRSKYVSMGYHRQFWQNYPLFVPFGRSPAKCLVLNTPVSIGKVRVLLLG